MRKVILLEHVSLDGFAAGLNGEMDWITFDDDVESYVHALHQTTDAAIYGRVTFEMMQGYWPTVLTDPNAGASALNHARWLDGATKIAISRTMAQPAWRNSLVIGDNLGEEIRQLKQKPGKDMWLIGSISTVQSFARLGLIDEYWLNINPVVLGSGRSLFGDVPVNLKLLKATPFKCGVVGLQYTSSNV